MSWCLAAPNWENRYGHANLHNSFNIASRDIKIPIIVEVEHS